MKTRNYAFREDLCDPQEIRAVLRLLVERCASATVTEGGRTLRLQADGYDDATAEMTFRMLGAPPRPPFVIVAAGYNAVYRLLVRSMRTDDGRLWIGVPEAIERVRSRRVKRVSVAEGLRVSFDHPLFPERRWCGRCSTLPTTAFRSRPTAAVCRSTPASTFR